MVLCELLLKKTSFILLYLFVLFYIHDTAFRGPHPQILKLPSSHKNQRDLKVLDNCFVILKNVVIGWPWTTAECLILQHSNHHQVTQMAFYS